MRHINIILFVVLLLCGQCFAAEYYVSPNAADDTGDGSSGDPKKYIQSALDLCNESGGDTVILKDGTYSHANDIINYSHFPSGSSYTTIKAENDWDAIIQNNVALGDDNNSVDYVSFEGLKFSGDFTRVFVGDRIKLIRCSIGGGTTTSDSSSKTGFGMKGNPTATEYILIEDCWFYGFGARYTLLFQSVKNVIVRRAVFRYEGGSDQDPGNPGAIISVYNTQNVDLQNVLIVDCDDPNYADADGKYKQWNAAILTPNKSLGDGFGFLSRDLAFRGCIILNHQSFETDSRAHGFYFDMDAAMEEGSDPITIDNCVVWDNGGYSVALGSSAFAQNLEINQCTFGVARTDTSYRGGGVIDNSTGGTKTVYNSIFTDFLSTYRTIDDNTTHDYNTQYNNVVTNSEDNPYNSDPESNGLSYLPRIESGTGLYSGNGVDSGRIGAIIEKKIGADGTFYSDEDYNTTTNNDLWPWPYESQIRDDMLAVSARGFCAPNTTLTEYIWEYLGNEIPSEIYGADETPPVISGESPSGEQPCSEDPKTITISVNTDEAATCRYSLDGDGGDDEDTAYADLNNEFTTTGGTGHSSNVSSACSGSYSYWVRCTDGTNINTSSTEISYSVGAPYAPRILGNGTKMFTTSGGKLLKN